MLREPIHDHVGALATVSRIRGFFSIKQQLDYATSSHVSGLVAIPDTLAQELPSAKEMLKILDRFDDQAIAAFTKLNSMNLARLLSRSIRNKIVSGIALTISVIGLVINIQDVFALSIKDSIDWLSRFNLSSLFLLMIVLLTVFAVLIAGINWVFTTPRIGLVDAYGDIL